MFTPIKTLHWRQTEVFIRQKVDTILAGPQDAYFLFQTMQWYLSENLFRLPLSLTLHACTCCSFAICCCCVAFQSQQSPKLPLFPIFFFVFCFGLTAETTASGQNCHKLQLKKATETISIPSCSCSSCKQTLDSNVNVN